MANLSIIKVNPAAHKDALHLIKELDTELYQLYPGDSVHTLDLQKIDSLNGVFLVGYLDTHPVACGAIYRLEPGIGEIKRVYVKPQARGQGLSKLILNHLEQEARRMGFTLLKLETGPLQPEALGLYRNAGYTTIPNFGEYIGDPYSICMEKQLVL